MSNICNISLISILLPTSTEWARRADRNLPSITFDANRTGVFAVVKDRGKGFNDSRFHEPAGYDPQLDLAGVISTSCIVHFLAAVPFLDRLQDSAKRHLQCLLACVHTFSNVSANKMQKSILSPGSLGHLRLRECYSVCISGVMLAVLADPPPGKLSYRGKMSKTRRLSEGRPGPIGVRRCSKCLKAQPQHLPQSSC